MEEMFYIEFSLFEAIATISIVLILLVGASVWAYFCGKKAATASRLAISNPEPANETK